MMLIFQAVLLVKVGRFFIRSELQNNINMNYKEQMEKWMREHRNATPEECFEAGWMLCTDSWCHHKREKMEQVCEMMKEIIG